MFSKLLVCSDGSEHALHAAAAAAQIAARFGSEVTVLHVFHAPTSLAYVADAPEFSVDLGPEANGAVQNAVARRTGRVLEEAGVAYTIRQEIGAPAQVIVETAERGRYDLIVLGSRGLGSFQSLLLGSVSDQVLHHAHCPVLVVRGPVSGERRAPQPS